MALGDHPSLQLLGSSEDGSGDGSSSSIPRALQRVFYNLMVTGLLDPQTQEAPAIQCKELIRSFGWDTADQFTQHDAQELNRLLCDRLEDKMKGTGSEGEIRRLFAGESEVYIECLNVDYKSKRTEIFYDLQLDVKGVPNLEISLDEYIREELLDGENCYQAEGYGPQPARKGTRFLNLPPVLQFHLKRFQFDLASFEMVKVNDVFEFPESISFAKWCPNAKSRYRLFAVNVHSGDVHEGHYYAFVRVPNPDFNDPVHADNPFENCSWVKFDDENVWRCDQSLVIENNFGGEISTLNNPYQSTTTHHHPQRYYSAYILFYIDESRAWELLRQPSPALVNPGMVLRLHLLDRLRKKQMKIRKDVESNIKINLLTENDLYGQNFYLIASLRSNVVIKRNKDISAYDLWKEVCSMLQMGKFGDILKNKYGSYIPILFYVDYDSNEKKDWNTLGNDSGWSPTTSSIDEIGTGICLWPLEFRSPRDSYQYTTLRTNVSYMHIDATNKKKSVLNIVVHPSYSPNLLVDDPESSGPRDPRTLDFSHVFACHENRSVYPLKIFDTFTQDVTQQTCYFVGLLPYIEGVDVYSAITEKIVSSCDRLAVAASPPLLQAIRALNRQSDVIWEICFENRGYFDEVPYRFKLNTHPSKTLVVNFPMGNPIHPSNFRIPRSSIGQLPRKIDECVFLDGRVTDIPLLDLDLVPPPAKTPQPDPQRWLKALRNIRNIQIVLYDLGEYFGRWEGVDCHPIDGNICEEESCLKSIKRVETEIDLNWSLETLLFWICGTLLKVDYRYLWLCINSPLKPDHGEKSVLYIEERKRPYDDPIRVSDIIHRTEPNGTANLFGTISQSQGKFGLIPSLIQMCAKPTDTEGPTLYLLLSPRPTVLHPGSSLIVRLFDPSVGTLGGVIVDNIPENMQGNNNK